MKTPINTFIEEMNKVRAFVDNNDGIPAEADITYVSDSAYAKAYFAKESELLADKKIFKIYHKVPGFVGGKYETEKATQMILQGQDDSKMTIQERPYEETIVPNILKRNVNNGKYYLVYYTLKNLDYTKINTEIMIIDHISTYDPLFKPNTPLNKMPDDFRNIDNLMEIARPATDEEKAVIKSINDAHTKTYDTLVDNYKLISVDNIVELDVRMDKTEKVYEENKPSNLKEGYINESTTIINYQLDEPDDMWQQINDLYKEYCEKRGISENDMYDATIIEILIDVASLSDEGTFLVNQYIEALGGIESVIEKDIEFFKEMHITRNIGTLKDIIEHRKEPKGWYQGEPYWDKFPGRTEY